MNTEIVNLFCNLIPGLIILYYLFDGWNKGALFMLVSLVRLFGSYYIARFLSNMTAQFLLTIPFIRSTITSIAANHQTVLTQLQGGALLFTGQNLDISMDTIAWWILYFICFVVIFGVLMIFFAYLLRLSKAFNRVPVLGTVNRLLGVAEGLVFGIGFTLLLIYIAVFIFRIIGEDQLSNSLLSSWLPVMFRTYFKWSF